MKRTKRSKKELVLKRHRRRMHRIVISGIMFMLVLSIEYVRGGTEQIYKTFEWIKHIPERYSHESIVAPDLSGRLEVHFLDVGQADCTLILTEGASMLIDAGNDDDGELIVEYLRSHGVTQLDYIVGTHPHEDHIGGMDDVIEKIAVDEVILPEVSTDSPVYSDLMNAIDSRAVHVATAVPGRELSLNEAIFTILSPLRDYKEELNNWSVGIRLVFGENEFLFTGDAEELAEIDMVESGQYLRSDVWKAGHHGSESSNTEWMLDVVAPEYVVVSCGKDNSYGHPHLSVLREWDTRGISVFRTDQMGTIVAYCNGKDIRWNK